MPVISTDKNYWKIISLIFVSFSFRFLSNFTCVVYFLFNLPMEEKFSIRTATTFSLFGEQYFQDKWTDLNIFFPLNEYHSVVSLQFCPVYLAILKRFTPKQLRNQQFYPPSTVSFNERKNDKRQRLSHNLPTVYQVFDKWER